MVGVVVAGHGGFAEALVAAAEQIVGKLAKVEVVNLLAHEGLSAGTQKIEAAVVAVDDGAGVVLLADVFGGTPSNCCLSLLERRKLEVVTGVNLPMLLRLATSRADGQKAAEVADELVAYGRQHITNASDMLRARCQAVRD